ncbi:hypothetical protein CkaCkLH20_01661 [Colletotrichum karsti]|uniref:Uncharacterized protein n=1 Tax=Colletotrichum karsti TaxID=1095194 RepID=A0A9P6LLP2_9PEZI|nr:uncharacterized protein CkaCkLH20_01661 [Colletotrichum karsti]KAF9880619.1 hypothetical protein CkaCkLH20_01661 [Colletotrichum karsti]
MTKSEDELHSNTSVLPPERKETSTGHRARYAKVYKFFGFNHGYNFPLWVIFAGGMLGFSLSRLKDLDYDGHFKRDFALVPGYWYYFRDGHYRYGMLIHLASVLPAGVLMVFQFTPVIRHKFLSFHRINGYVVLLLCLISNFSAFVVIRHKQGGHRANTQTVETLMGIMTTVGIVLAWWNIRRKQIDQHRAWMLRTMFYMGITITARLINLAATPIITRIGGYFSIWMCDEINFLYGNYGMEFPSSNYPNCLFPNGTLDRWKHVVVRAVENPERLEELGSSITIGFGTMLWICLLLHVVGVEVYLWMTPRESERLRLISYEKQLEAGYRQPGSAGLVLDRWADAEPVPPDDQAGVPEQSDSTG